MNKLKIKKGDKVKVITGKDKGKIGNVIKVFLTENKLLISGVNLVIKHTKPGQTSEGGIIKKELPIHVSNVSHIVPKTNKITKVGYRVLDDGSKVRVAKRSGKIIAKEGK